MKIVQSPASLGKINSTSTGVSHVRSTPGVISLKFRSVFFLFVLTLQNTALILLMKYSYRPSSDRYSSSSVVVLAEALKLTFCFLLVVSSVGLKFALVKVFEASYQIRFIVPSLLYVAQNNLLYEGVKRLPTTVYVACSQGKIFTCAFFSYTMLGTSLRKKEMLALLFLALGMFLVQSNEDLHSRQLVSTSVSREIGFAAVLVACCTSGYAGVYLERIYKRDTHDDTILSKNMQLSLFSFPVSVSVAMIKDGRSYRSDGIFAGYDSCIVAIIFLQALGGIIVASVMRYASNLLKCFAMSASVCLCATISVVSGSEQVTFASVLGVFLIITATLLYS
mmetsp:Transcript_4869/g.17412  ORF Transcript_4869/g.17412 Transcript_4869/m.17412 type:complete len:336 (-) Transcript_4869:2826-3833(-)